MQNFYETWRIFSCLPKSRFTALTSDFLFFSFFLAGFWRKPGGSAAEINDETYTIF